MSNKNIKENRIKKIAVIISVIATLCGLIEFFFFDKSTGKNFFQDLLVLLIATPVCAFIVYTMAFWLLDILYPFYSIFYNEKDTTNFNDNANQEYAQKEQQLHQEFEYTKEKMRQEFQDKIDEMYRQYQETFERQQQEYERENQRGNNKTYAEILGIAENASKAEIKAAYRHKMQSFHPDKNPNITPEVAQMLKEQAQKINEAYEFLMQNAKD